MDKIFRGTLGVNLLEFVNGTYTTDHYGSIYKIVVCNLAPYTNFVARYVAYQAMEIQNP